MRFFLRSVVLLLVALPLLAFVALAMCLQDRPLVTRTVQLTAQDIERAKRIVRAQDPRKADRNGLQVVSIDERDLDLALNYLAHRLGRGAATVALRPGAVQLQASLELPHNPFGRYVNVDAELRETAGVPRVERLRIGSLPVPVIAADWLLREGLRRALATERGELAAYVIRGMKVGEGRVTVTYYWSDEVAGRARAVLVDAARQARLRVYHERLVETVAGMPAPVSVAALMPPLFRLAVDRGGAADIVAENRAALVVLALYATGRGMGELVPAAKQWPQPAWRTVTLAGRDDFAKHFLLSAAIAAEGGSPLADAIGVYKEIADSRGGSGFSFNDMGANRAGTRFGEVASQSPGRARQLARAVASGVKESDFMPDVSDLPEFLPEAEFVRRFGGVDGAGYGRMMGTIEERVGSLPLLR
jgi:hypothetical protein